MSLKAQLLLLDTSWALNAPLSTNVRVGELVPGL